MAILAGQGCFCRQVGVTENEMQMQGVFQAETAV